MLPTLQPDIYKVHLVLSLTLGGTGESARRFLRPLAVENCSLVFMVDKTGDRTARNFNYHKIIIRNYFKENYRFYLVVPDYNC